MKDKNSIINEIQDALGSEASRELAETMFDVFRADDRMYYDDARGLILRNDVDLIALAGELTRHVTGAEKKMTTMTQAHALADFSPDLTAAYSPNLHQWLRRHGMGRKEDLVLDCVYRVRAGSRLAEHYGGGALMIGSPYAAYEGDTDFSGVCLMGVLCHGADASRVCLAGALESLEEVPDFWTRYQQIGRCAIDIDHTRSFVHGERYTTAGDIEICMWCGHQRRANEPATLNQK